MSNQKNYTPYHIHSMLSNGITNIDSITDFHDYVDKAKALGMKAFAFSEHGNTFAWLKKKEYIESCGMKYIHAVEAYITEDEEIKYMYSANELKPYRDTETKEIKYKAAKKVQFKEYYYDNVCEKEVAEIEEKGEKRFAYIDINTIKQEGIIKTKDNYHIVLIAKNEDGVHELNKLISESFNRKDNHYYYYPRIKMSELENTSDNILVTTACLGGVLNKGTPIMKEKFLSFLIGNKHRCWLEIQHHNCEDQIEYNKMLYELSKSLGLKLIVGTDSHAISEEHMKGRKVLQLSKKVNFDDEDSWDLVFKSYDELVAAFKKQDSLPMDIVLDAIEETNVLADLIEKFDVDRNAKYPKLYDDSEKVFKEKINQGVIDRGINKFPKDKRKIYFDRIHEEYDTYKHNGAIDFMLLEENYKGEMRRQNIHYGYSRGSVSGSLIAYLLHITEVDSVKYNLNFERFMNRERVSLADVDTDWFSPDKEFVKQYLYNKEGLHCCDIVTFNTIAIKGTIKDICRGLYFDNLKSLKGELKEKVTKWDKEQNDKLKKYSDQGIEYKIEPYPESLAKEIRKHSIHKYIPLEYVKFSESLIDEYEKDPGKVREKYKELFYYVDMVNGVVVSVGNHPAGTVVSPFPVDEWFGTFTTSTDEYPISVLNMKEIDSLNFVKLDVLGLTD